MTNLKKIVFFLFICLIYLDNSSYAMLELNNSKHLFNALKFGTDGNIRGAKSELWEDVTANPHSKTTAWLLELVADFEQEKISKEALITVFDGYYLAADKVYDQALTTFTKAISLAPDHSKPYLSRGIIYYINQRYSEALADFNQVLLINKQEPAAYFYKANILFIKNEMKQALESCELFLMLAPPPLYPQEIKFCKQVLYLKGEFSPEFLMWEEVKNDDVLGWKGATWGISSAELETIFQEKLYNLRHQEKFPNMYTEYTLPAYRIFDQPFTVFFQMDNKTKKLQSVLIKIFEFTPEKTKKSLFEKIEKEMTSTYGKPIIEKDESNNFFTELRRKWEFKTTTILLSYEYSRNNNRLTIQYTASEQKQPLSKKKSETKKTISHLDTENTSFPFFKLIALLLTISASIFIFKSTLIEKLTGTKASQKSTHWDCPSCGTSNTFRHHVCWKCQVKKPVNK